ncbi:hypothetical protein A8L34_23925 [Bacillus sp. FJAT-27264]|uniref:GNAT family N-acetyltransferase n=1 Tax=Paenibacillus sp. (strain DSM 101736 / FJAT-27264) TaxID=1850362 RepID=UPI000807DD85|nr:GNAT family N-acetyltransferase [Bacillus sp. FJAT-27264]OBZ08365.1 hypothetical protein A8L34_23925 [Bacillus sp. FJAT-27264]
MITLEAVSEPMSPENIEIQTSMMNSQPSYNLVVMGKALLTSEEILEENTNNFESGEKMFYIRKHDENIGIVTYLLRNPHDNHTWIGLLIIHKDHEGHGIGREAVELIESKLRQENVDKVRLCVQKENESGALFWGKNEYVIVNSSIDQRGNPIDIYEKKL